MNLKKERDFLKKLQIISNNPRLQDLEYELCRKDPYYWLTNYAFTLDSHDKKFPVKRFPDKKYLKIYTKLWFDSPLFLVLKSRQLMVSWVSVALLLWEIQFKQGRFCFVQSKKEDDANSLLERAYFIYENQPKWIKRSPVKYSYCRLRCEENASSIMGIPQGGDQIRMHTASRIFIDEMAFQEEAEKSLVASKPTLDGGGSYCGVSTAEPSFFQTLVDFNAPEKQLMKGMSLKKNDIGFKVLKLHYTADPDKRKSDWINKAKKGQTKEGWQKEMEMDFGAFSGQLALMEIKKFKKRIWIDPFDIPDNWKIYGSIDYGYRNPFACYFYAVNEEGKIYVVWEHYQAEKPISYHVKKIKECPFYYRAEYIVIDPSTTAMTQQDSQGGLRSIWERLIEAGLDNLQAGRRAEIAALDRIKQMFLEDKLSLFKNCPYLLWELEALRFQEMTVHQLRQKNVKERLVDKDNHGWDCLKYFILSLPDPAEVKKENKTSIMWDAIKSQFQHKERQEKDPLIEEFENDNKGYEIQD